MPAEEKVRQAQAQLARAIQLHQSGQLAAAEPLYRQVLAVQPQQPDALHFLGLLKHQLGDAHAALTLLHQAQDQQPRNPHLLAHLGQVNAALGRYDEAIECFNRAVTIDPHLIEALGGKGLALEEQGGLDEAAACYENILQFEPGSVDALINLGGVRWRMGNLRAAETALVHAIKLAPQRAEAHFNLGQVFEAKGEWGAAAEHLEMAARLQPDRAESFFQLGNVLLKAGSTAKAAQSFQYATQLAPERADVWAAFGAALQRIERLDESLAAFHRALQLAPDDWRIRRNLADTLLTAGQLDECIAAYRAVLSVVPEQANVFRALLAAYLYHPAITGDFVYAAHVRFGQAYAERAAPLTLAASTMETNRLLRVGYLSSDFCAHPVAFNFEPVLRAHDPKRVEVFLYAHNPAPDAVSDRLRALAAGWREIAALSDEEVACQIAADRIDILVILAAHFDHNRPLVARFRPAPIQVSFHDPATSGVAEIDYLITDITLTPRDSRERLVERPVRLPTYYLAPPIHDVPPVSALPVASKGVVTFISCSNPAKLNESVLGMWAKVLQAVPDSRLILKYKNLFAVPSIRSRISAIFESFGIDLDRIEFASGDRERAEHFGYYNRSDIALDPFPFTGSTTTFEALWMGVPVITLAGETMVSRWSASMLRRVGMEELIAHTPEDYVRIAQTLAQDLPRLAELRRTLRERVAESPLCDARARTRQLERAYRWMWRKWCAEHGKE